MVWTKLGLIFRPNSALPWQRSHATAPTPVLLRNGVLRVFFACRDDANRSSVGYFDVDPDEPERVVNASNQPVLSPGPLGYFDDHGVYAASAVWSGQQLYLYTIGWNPGPRAPLFYSSIGLAISDDGGDTFRKFSPAPIMARSEHDPALVTSPFVLHDHGRWRMWYVSGQAWERAGEELHSNYHIKYAESDDGVFWRRNGTICIESRSPAERNIGRMCVLRGEKGYRAWFSSSAGQDGYRIGGAVSADGVAWQRLGKAEEPGLSKEGWDSKATAHPYIVRHNDRCLMFYNGNEFGRDGVGLAIASVTALGF